MSSLSDEDWSFIQALVEETIRSKVAPLEDKIKELESLDGTCKQCGSNMNCPECNYE